MISKRQKILSAICKLVVMVSAVLGTVLSAYAGRDTFMGGKVVFMYFTIQSNLLIALICAAGLYLLFCREDRIPDAWYVIKYVGTVAITLTGVVFCVILAPTMGDEAWNLQNILTHVAVPVVSVMDFFVVGISGSIRKRSMFWVFVPPLLYAVYAGIGYVCNWQFARGHRYPYFFLNWGSPAGAFGFTDELPYIGCVWWILIILLFLLFVGYLYLFLMDRLRAAVRRNGETNK